MTVEERLYKLEGIVEGVMATLPQEVFTLRHEVKDELRALRQEMEAFGKDLRQEIQTAINTGFNRMMLLLAALTLFLGFLALFGR